MITFDLDVWPGIVCVTVVPGESIMFAGRDVMHEVWDRTWDSWIWDEEMPGAATWFTALDLPARQKLAQLQGTSPKAASDYIESLGGNVGWLRGIEVVPASRQVREDFTFALRVGDLASSARTTDIGRISSITARTVKLLVAEWPGRQEKHRRYPICEFAFQNCRLDPVLLRIGER